MSEMQQDHRRVDRPPARITWQPWVASPLIGGLIVWAGSYLLIVLAAAIVMLTVIALAGVLATSGESRGERAERMLKTLLRWRDRHDPP